MGIYERQAAIARALASPARLRILEALLYQPACVSQLVTLIGQRQPYVSQQLAVLHRAGLVEREYFGSQVCYRLARSEMKNLLKALRSNLGEQVQPANTDKRGKKMNDTKNNTWHGIPRTEIEWHPTLIAERCIGCGLCATSCGRGVYAFDFEANKPVVVNPEMCMVGCTTCASICPQDAVEFPSSGYIRHLIRQKKILRQSKDMLRDDRAKYDVALREK